MGETITVTEHAEQVAVFQWAALTESACPALAFLFAIPNGGHRHPAVAARLKAEGVKAGVPDICLPVPRHGYHGLWVELKVGRNKPTPEQTRWHDMLARQGYLVALCYGADQAIEAIRTYLGKRNVQHGN